MLWESSTFQGPRSKLQPARLECGAWNLESGISPACRISAVRVEPINRVIGVSSAMAMAVRAAYDANDNTYQPSAPRVYEETAADRSPRCGSASETARPSMPIPPSRNANARTID